MTNDYQILKLSREELLIRAGYNKNHAVYQIMDYQGAEKAEPQNTQGQADH
jgi:hypothetical protein